MPNQIGIRNPAFAHVISLSEYAGNLTEVDRIAQAAVRGDEQLRHQATSFERPNQRAPRFDTHPIEPVQSVQPVQEVEPEVATFRNEVPQEEPKASFTDKMRNLIGNMFE